MKRRDLLRRYAGVIVIFLASALVVGRLVINLGPGNLFLVISRYILMALSALREARADSGLVALEALLDACAARVGHDGLLD